MAIDEDDDDDLGFLIQTTRRRPVPKALSKRHMTVIELPPELRGTRQTVYEYDDVILVELDFTPVYNTLTNTTGPVLPFFQAIDGIVDRITTAVGTASFIARLRLRRYLRAEGFQYIRRLRQARQARKAVRLTRSTATTEQFIRGQRASIKASRISRKIVSKGARIRRLRPGARKGARFLGGLKVISRLLRPLLIISVIADVILITHRAGKGGQQNGAAGFGGGLAGGVFDALTLSLAEPVGKKIESGVTQFLADIGSSFENLFGADAANISFGS